MDATGELSLPMSWEQASTSRAVSYRVNCNPRRTTDSFTVVLSNMGVKGFSIGVTRSFYFAFITSGVASGLTYYLLARFLPQQTYTLHKGEKFEEWSQDEVEMYAAGKREIVVRPMPGTETPSIEEKKDLEPGVNVLEV